MYDLLVVSSYPRFSVTRGRETVGVADYTKQTLTALPPSKKILVLSEFIKDEPIKVTEKNITVIRCWQRNYIFLFWQIFNQILKHPCKNVLIEFEMVMFGNPAINILFPKFLSFLKLINKKTIIVLHQVVTDFSEISGHIGQSKTSPINPILSLFAKIFYKFVILFSDKIIVFEQFLKNRLDKNNDKIIVIPHGVEINGAVKEANKNCEIDNLSDRSERADEIKPEGSEDRKNSSISNGNIFTITVFGFIAWYKGTDWIVRTMSNYFTKHPKSKIKLIIAGGPNPNHAHKAYYNDYLIGINNLAKIHPDKITITGFVDESQIKNYYRQSDLIILPYRVGMSSSGPLSIAFTYHKAFLVSEKISPIFQTLDIQNILQKYKTNISDFSFPLKPKNFLNKVISLQKNSQKLTPLQNISQKISQTRSWDNIIKLYLSIIS